MPLEKGSSPKTISDNIAELMRSYKRKAKIGNSSPKSGKAAQKQAAAIAYREAKK